MVINKQQSYSNLGLVAATVLILVGAGYSWHSLRHSDIPPTQSECFYTDDGGQTYYKDTILKFPPFDHDGKTAVEAKVFTDGNRTFVGMLWRYKPDMKKKLEDIYAQQGSAVIRYMLLAPVEYGGSEYKIVGGKSDWTSAAGMEMVRFKALDGTYPDPVAP
jgi:hypothetical protein